MATLVFAIYWLLLLCAPLGILAMPRFDPTATMQNVLVPADAAVGSVIYRLRATDTTFDFPLDFVLEGDNTMVSLHTLNCSRLNSVCQANVVLEKKLDAGRFYDFIVALRNPKGATIRMRCSFRATNATTPVADIFPGAPALVKVSENAKRNTELGTIIARGNPNREKAVLIELWGSPSFGLRQRLINDKDAEAAVVLFGPLDYETQSSYHLTILANDAWSEPGNDSRNIASWPLLIAVLDEQDTPPVFTLAPPVTILDPKLKPGDLILKVRAEDGDRGNPRDVRYGLVSEGNPFTPFFNLSEDKGELRLAKPLADIQAISHAGVPVLLTVVAEEIRVGADEPAAQSSSVQIALIPPVPSWASPHFSSPLFTAALDENSPPGTQLNLPGAEVIGDPGEVITLELMNNNGTFDVSPTVIEGRGKFVVTVHDSRLLDYEERPSVQCDLLAKQIGSENTTTARLIVMLNDINDSPPTFVQSEWHTSILENVEIGTSVLRVEAIDPDTKSSDHIRYIHLLGSGNQSFRLDSTSGLISVADPRELDAERVSKFQFSVEAADEDGLGLKATAVVTINLIDVNDETPKFEKDLYEFILDTDRKSFTSPAFIKATDADATSPNNVIHYELTSQIENVTLNKDTGELVIRPVWKQTEMAILKARAWDEGVPRLWSECEIRLYPPESRNRVITFIVPGLNPNRKAIEDELRALTGAQITVQEVRPYTGKDGENVGDRSQVVATVTYGPDTVVDVERIQQIYDRRSHEEIREAGLAWPWWILIILLIILLIIALILILCCICAPCPMYVPPRKRKIGSAEVSRLIVEGSGQGKNSKGVQVAEWFGRREAWTPEAILVDTEADSLRRHEFERGSDRGFPRRMVHKGQLTKEEPREQLYIREGNADILRLITRGSEQQRPTTLVEQSLVGDSGKDILMRRFIDQQTTSRTAAVNLPNEVNRAQLDQEQLEATLRQQNNLLRQILLERERELRFETQSLPAGTQTDRDAFTQTEPGYLRPPLRLTRSDNDASEASDEEIILPKKRGKHWRSRRKDAMPIKRRIRTPIQEESESNVESAEKQQKEVATSSTIDRLRSKVLRELLNEESSKSRPTRSAIRKEVLREIAESLVRSQESVSDDEVYTGRQKSGRYEHFSDDSIDNTSSPERDDITSTQLQNYPAERVGSTLSQLQKFHVERGDSSLSQSHKYHSETDLRVVSNGDQIKETKSVSQSDLSKTPKPNGKGNKKGGSRYMEWYSKVQKSSAPPGKGKQPDNSTTKPPGTSGVSARQAAAEAKARKKKAPGALESAVQPGAKAGPEHPLIQHSEHRFEAPVLLVRRNDDDVDSGIALARPPMAEKKSVFSIAYEDIQRQTRQLRPESSSPP